MNNDSSINYSSGNRGNNKGVIAALAVSLLLVIIVGAIVLTRNQKKSAEEASLLKNEKIDLSSQLTRRDSIINEWVVAFNEIESDIRKITARENMLTMQSMNPEISKDKKKEILTEIQYIRDLIDQNKKKITSLNSQLRKSGLNMAGLQARVDTLTANIQQRDTDIANLKMELVNRDFEIGEMSRKMDTMQLTLANRESFISHQTDEMNTAYYVKGTYKDLKEKGLIEKEGGVLGLGRKETVQEDSLKNDLFKQIDITQTTSIPVNSKSAKLVTEHPSGSYEMVKDGSDMISSIEIKDPASFWKLSKYAVVEVNR
ncbi:MAG TPA: hypothetical protein VK179_04515 [Bacteroidales bacterium]|nr:hypothetical protein [Bacteroidales bacterium]